MTRLFLVAAIFLATVPTTTLAQGWQFRVTPYVWAPSMDTSLRASGSPTADTSTSVLEVLEFAALVTGEARRGPLTILGEVNYLDLGDDATALDGAVRARVDLEGFLAAIAVAYALVETDRARVEGLAGARLWSLEGAVDPATLPKGSATATWVDPIIGLRATVAVADRVSLQAQGDIGGFGVGADLQWELVGRVGYTVSDRVTAAAGWRHLAVKADRGGLDIDLNLTGPFVAFDISF